MLGDEVSEGRSQNGNGEDEGVVALVSDRRVLEDVTVLISKLYDDPFARYCG